MGDIRKRFLPQKRSHIWVLESAFKSAFVGYIPKYEICPHLFISSSSSFLLPVTVRFFFLPPFIYSCRRSCSCSFVCRRYCSSSLHSVPVPVRVRPIVAFPESHCCVRSLLLRLPSSSSFFPLLQLSPPFTAFLSILVSFFFFHYLFRYLTV